MSSKILGNSMMRPSTKLSFSNFLRALISLEYSSRNVNAVTKKDDAKIQIIFFPNPFRFTETFLGDRSRKGRRALQKTMKKTTMKKSSSNVLYLPIRPKEMLASNVSPFLQRGR